MARSATRDINKKVGKCWKRRSWKQEEKLCILIDLCVAYTNTKSNVKLSQSDEDEGSLVSQIPDIFTNTFLIHDEKPVSRKAALL